MSDRTDELRKALSGNKEIVLTRHGKEVARILPRQPQASPTPGGQADRSCSFCGKAQAEVAKLIAGPAASICNECVSLCLRILREGGIDPEAGK